MRFHRVIPVILMLGSWATSSARAQPGSPAPFASEPILAEAAAGAVMAFGMSLGMARLGSELLGPKGGEDPGLAGALVGFAAGLTLGASLGVHLVARGYRLPARYEEALAGALAGVLLLPAVPIDLDRAGTWVAIFAVPTATAVIASSLGSSSRTVRPSARALRNGIGVGVELAF
jgi:hypothetical protein